MRNVRAAVGRVVLGRRVRRAATLVEVPVVGPARGDPGLPRPRGRRGRSWGTAGEARHYFGVDAAPTDEQLRRVAERYPVFHVRYGGAVP